jgi:predicted AAA+ superfamily ATPase
MRPDLISCFDGIQDTNTIINNLRFKDSNFIFEEKHTLIFFDEIQLCKKALASLKTLVKENKYDFICSGSIITLKIEKKDFYPIGAIQHEIMRPLDFEEFM